MINKLSREHWCYMAILSVFWLVIVNLMLPNAGGIGIYLPLNLLTWGVMSGLCFLVWVNTWHRPLHISRTWLWLCISACCFTLPVLWISSSEALNEALPRLLAIWGGVIVYLALLQCRFTAKCYYFILGLFSASGIIQCLIVLIGLWRPEWLDTTHQILLNRYGRGALGGFQQVNVSASYISTGLAAQIFLLASKQSRLTNLVYDFFHRWILGLLIVIAAMTLVLMRSRIGWIGLIFVTVGLNGYFLFYAHRRLVAFRVLTLLLPLAGTILGIVLLDHSITQVLAEHDSSNHQRWFTLVNAVNMIALHPWKGWGLGCFSSQYLNYLASIGAVGNNHELMEHPHNEIIYAWVEGGIFGLMGIIFLCIAGINLLRHSRTILQRSALICASPILLHTQVEFPLYYSAPHFIMLLILFTTVERRSLLTVINKSQVQSRMLTVFLAAISLIGSMECFLSLSPTYILSEFELSRLPRPERIKKLDVPWLINYRWQHDLNSLRLIYPQNHLDMQSLRLFTIQNEQWLSVHADADMYQNQVAVLAWLGEKSVAQEWKARAKRFFPYDLRF